MSDSQQELKKYKPQNQYLVAIDSDGCAFDTMEIKHKECFIPNIINHWHLQPVSKYARAAAEFVHLFDKIVPNMVANFLNNRTVDYGDFRNVRCIDD